MAKISIDVAFLSKWKVDPGATTRAFEERLRSYIHDLEETRKRSVAGGNTNQDECSCATLMLQIARTGKAIDDSCRIHQWNVVNEVSQYFENAARGHFAHSLVASRKTSDGANTAICPGCAQVRTVLSEGRFRVHRQGTGLCPGSGMWVE
jgi:hypothetical protein